MVTLHNFHMALKRQLAVKVCNKQQHIHLACKLMRLQKFVDLPTNRPHSHSLS